MRALDACEHWATKGNGSAYKSKISSNTLPLPNQKPTPNGVGFPFCRSALQRATGRPQGRAPTGGAAAKAILPPLPGKDAPGPLRARCFFSLRSRIRIYGGIGCSRGAPTRSVG
jgi:hypothetical protein